MARGLALSASTVAVFLLGLNLGLTVLLAFFTAGHSPSVSPRPPNLTATPRWAPSRGVRAGSSAPPDDAGSATTAATDTPAAESELRLLYQKLYTAGSRSFEIGTHITAEAPAAAAPVAPTPVEPCAVTGPTNATAAAPPTRLTPKDQFLKAW